jgi:hypothetical protein
MQCCKLCVLPCSNLAALTHVVTEIMMIMHPASPSHPSHHFHITATKLKPQGMLSHSTTTPTQCRHQAKPGTPGKFKLSLRDPMQVVGTLEALGTRQPPVPPPALVQQVSDGREELVLGVLGTAAQPPGDASGSTSGKHPGQLAEEDQISTDSVPVQQRLRTPVCLPRPVAGCFCKTETLHD